LTYDSVNYNGFLFKIEVESIYFSGYYASMILTFVKLVLFLYVTVVGKIFRVPFSIGYDWILIFLFFLERLFLEVPGKIDLVFFNIYLFLASGLAGELLNFWRDVLYPSNR
jgi:hypothetical protein